jgi:predicted Fe-Mo cluster-binding NifX family protein
MKVAFTVWNNRIAPLFDVSRRVHIVESVDGHIVGRCTASIDNDMPTHKAKQLAEMGIQTLVCGAISRSLESLVTAYGIELVAFINGDLQEVVDAWQCGKIYSDNFIMPGCRGYGRGRFSEGQSIFQEERQMNANKQGGAGQGGAAKGRRGQGGGQGRGRRNAGSTGSAAASGVCICPQCGNQEPHQRGIPCMQKACAKCGAVMTRQ